VDIDGSFTLGMAIQNPGHAGDPVECFGLLQGESGMIRISDRSFDDLPAVIFQR
jgi:hypothetical protein